MSSALFVDQRGWCQGVRAIASPNYDARPEKTAIDLLVLHHISLPPREFEGQDVIALFTNTLDCHAHPYYTHLQTIKVSTHFFIRRTGEIIQCVSCEARAWHAGVSRWQGRSQCNDFSLSVELEGHEYIAYTEAQYSALAKLMHALKQRYPLQHVVGHQDIAPERKTDPGPYFDWQRIDAQWAASN